MANWPLNLYFPRRVNPIVLQLYLNSRRKALIELSDFTKDITSDYYEGHTHITVLTYNYTHTVIFSTVRVRCTLVSLH